MGKIGITTSIPVEAIFAAGHVPVDLNNAFITSADRRGLIEEAETAGLPSSTCGWIKGIYAAARHAGVDAVVGVMGGDCSNTKALIEIWQFDGLETIPFAYPYDHTAASLEVEIRLLCERLGADFDEASRWKGELDEARRLAAEVDRLSWMENKVTGFESHLHQVSASDFNSDVELYKKTVSAFIDEARAREPMEQQVRLGYVGVPTVFDGLYELLESVDARVVFNETQRQFALPYLDDDLVEAYRKFTYPYDVFSRVEDIKAEIERRGLHGIIHYVQSFCFRQMEDVILRKSLGVPVLTIEGDRPTALDGRTRTRLESFVEMLSMNII